MKMIGGSMGIVEPGMWKNVTFLYPNMYLYNRRGECDVEVWYKDGANVTDVLKAVIPFDTYVRARRIPECMLSWEMIEGILHCCHTPDLDPLDNCRPVDCHKKYNGHKNYFDPVRRLCICNPTCYSDPNKEMPDVAYVAGCNECRDLEEPISEEDMLALLRPSEYLQSDHCAVKNPEADEFRNVRCHHGSFNRAKMMCDCEIGWTSAPIPEDMYIPSTLLLHFCTIKKPPAKVFNWDPFFEAVQSQDTSSMVFAAGVLSILLVLLVLLCAIVQGKVGGDRKKSHTTQGNRKSTPVVMSLFGQADFYEDESGESRSSSRMGRTHHSGRTTPTPETRPGQGDWGRASGPRKRPITLVKHKNSRSLSGMRFGSVAHQRSTKTWESETYQSKGTKLTERISIKRKVAYFSQKPLKQHLNKFISLLFKGSSERFLKRPSKHREDSKSLMDLFSGSYQSSTTHGTSIDPKESFHYQHSSKQYQPAIRELEQPNNVYRSSPLNGKNEETLHSNADFVDGSQWVEPFNQTLCVTVCHDLNMTQATMYNENCLDESLSSEDIQLNYPLGTQESTTDLPASVDQLTIDVDSNVYNFFNDKLNENIVITNENEFSSVQNYPATKLSASTSKSFQKRISEESGNSFRLTELNETTDLKVETFDKPDASYNLELQQSTCEDATLTSENTINISFDGCDPDLPSRELQIPPPAKCSLKNRKKLDFSAEDHQSAIPMIMDGKKLESEERYGEDSSIKISEKPHFHEPVHISRRSMIPVLRSSQKYTEELTHSSKKAQGLKFETPEETRSGVGDDSAKTGCGNIEDSPLVVVSKSVGKSTEETTSSHIGPQMGKRKKKSKTKALEATNGGEMKTKPAHKKKRRRDARNEKIIDACKKATRNISKFLKYIPGNESKIKVEEVLSAFSKRPKYDLWQKLFQASGLEVSTNKLRKEYRALRSFEHLILAVTNFLDGEELLTIKQDGAAEGEDCLVGFCRSAHETKRCWLLVDTFRRLQAGRGPFMAEPSPETPFCPRAFPVRGLLRLSGPWQIRQLVSALLHHGGAFKHLAVVFGRPDELDALESYAVTVSRIKYHKELKLHKPDRGADLFDYVLSHIVYLPPGLRRSAVSLEVPFLRILWRSLLFLPQTDNYTFSMAMNFLSTVSYMKMVQNAKAASADIGRLQNILTDFLSVQQAGKRIALPMKVVERIVKNMSTMKRREMIIKLVNQQVKNVNYSLELNKKRPKINNVAIQLRRDLENAVTRYHEALKDFDYC